MSLLERSLGIMRPVSDLRRAAKPFEVISPYTPSGDQPTAISEQKPDLYIFLLNQFLYSFH